MLELLYGPVELLDLAAVAVVDDNARAGRYYDDDVGLIFSEGPTQLKSWVVQLDGTACLRGADYGQIIVDMQDPGEYLLLAGNAINSYDKRAATRNGIILNLGSGDQTNLQVRCADRYLSAYGSPSNPAVRWRPLDCSVTAVNETALIGCGTFSVESYYATWSRTRNPDIMALAFQNGNIIYYNIKTKAQAPGADFIGQNSNAWYSPKHNIWVKIPLVDRKIYVHAGTPRPTALSAPAGAAAQRGRVTTYTVQSTGDAGEPCPGELIGWSLLGGSLGQLSATQSKTDSNGNATIDYIAPVTGTLGNATIHAELRC